LDELPVNADELRRSGSRFGVAIPSSEAASFVWIKPFE